MLCGVKAVPVMCSCQYCYFFHPAAAVPEENHRHLLSSFTKCIGVSAGAVRHVCRAFDERPPVTLRSWSIDTPTSARQRVCEAINKGNYEKR